jgi:hypothetical protein
MSFDLGIYGQSEDYIYTFLTGLHIFASCYVKTRRRVVSPLTMQVHPHILIEATVPLSLCVIFFLRCRFSHCFPLMRRLLGQLENIPE